MAFFNGHYDSWCSLPLVATLTFNDEAEQIWSASSCASGPVLRTGARSDSCGPCSGGCGRRLLGEAYGLSKYSDRTEYFYEETRYAAQSWSHRCRVIIKAEVIRLPGHEPKCNPRFVVTNLRETPAAIYAVYCQRGDMENRLKELHHGLPLDRTSCSRFWANQFRVLLTAAPYVLLQALRQQSHGTDSLTAQVSTL